MLSKKGITPVIATVLLLMMTVSAAAGAYYWITTVQSSLQQDAQGAIASSGISGGFRISILSGGISCNGTSDEVTVYVKNAGTQTIPAGTWYSFLKNTQNIGVGTWSSSESAFNSGNTLTITFALDSGNGMSSGNTYTIQVSPSKGTSATTSCRATT